MRSSAESRCISPHPRSLVPRPDSASAMAARNALHGRKFGGSVVIASLMGMEDYRSNKWD